MQTFLKSTNVAKIQDHELLLPDNFGSGWDNVLLAQKINKWGGGVAIRMSWYAFVEKNKWLGDVYSGLESNVCPQFTNKYNL